MIQEVERRRITEADLFARPDGPVTVVPCACGGQVAAIFGNWDDIAQAINQHAQGDRHQRWRRWQEVE